ncbi:hypothetical protein [Streptomyces atroolivaceus]|uniref:hypothetical protein n=1 Tax=Streptomyces atroolivaceus TaxID=66869 RepID=UPI002023DD58|nr:hypothetical protein [Streptomyces atroolivaceus]
MIKARAAVLDSLYGLAFGDVFGDRWFGILHRHGSAALEARMLTLDDGPHAGAAGAEKPLDGLGAGGRQQALTSSSWSWLALGRVSNSAATATPSTAVSSPAAFGRRTAED